MNQLNCTQRTKAMALTLGDELDSTAGGRDDVLLHLLGLQTPVRGSSSGCSKSGGGTSGRSAGSHPGRKGSSGLITARGGGAGRERLPSPAIPHPSCALPGHQQPSCLHDRPPKAQPTGPPPTRLPHRICWLVEGYQAAVGGAEGLHLCHPRQRHHGAGKAGDEPSPQHSAREPSTEGHLGLHGAAPARQLRGTCSPRRGGGGRNPLLQNG